MKLATLGPAGTFSELAALKYHHQNTSKVVNIVYYSHLQRALQAVPDECEQVVVPIENVSEGFVPVVLDYLVAADMHIVDEVRLPIAFSVCGQAANVQAITRLYVQFVARGQCREFIDSLGDIELIPTQSNSESMELALKQGANSAAIVPNHLLESRQSKAAWSFIHKDVHDYSHNETRFVVLAAGAVPASTQGQKTSIMVINDNDRPGLLEQVLHCFSTRRLNLSSIVSRPTGQGFGQYHFFIDAQSNLNNIAMQGALAALRQIAQVKVLGCY